MSGEQFILVGRFIDGSGAAVGRHLFLALRGGVISAIGPAAELPRLEGAAIIDLSHCTMVPALVDCSTFLARSPSLAGEPAAAAKGAEDPKKLLQRQLHDCHAHGVLGVADNDDLGELLADYRRGPEPKGPKHEGPKKPEGVVTVRTPSPLGPSLLSGAADAPAGGDFLKLFYANSIESGTSADKQLPPALLTRAELGRILARKGARKAVVVANGRQQVAEALAAGCDAIEQGYGMGADNIREMARRKILWIPSLLRAKNALDGSSSGGEVCCRFSLRYVAPGLPIPGAEAFWRQTLNAQLAQLTLARQLGVATALGTGAGTLGILHGESMVEEMKLFIKAGYSLPEAIRCASTNGANFFGLDHLGPLTVGRRATFLLTRGTAQQLPRKLSYLEGIYLDGTPSPIYHKFPITQ